MPAKSKAQQRFFGYLLSNPDERKKEGVSRKVARDFAGTKHKGLPEKVKEGIDNAILERLGGKGYSKKATGGGGDWEDSDRGEGNKATRRAGGKVKVKSPTYIAHVKNKKLKEDAPTMSTGSDPAGFSNDADNNGPVAGLDQPLGGTQKQPRGKGAKKALKYKCKTSKDGVNGIDCRVKSNVKEGRQPDDAASSGNPRNLPFKVRCDSPTCPGCMEFIYYGKSPAEVKIELRKIYRPEKLKHLTITRVYPADVLKYYWDKRRAAM